MTKKPTRESRYVQVARQAHKLTKKHFPTYTHKHSPKKFTQPQLAACVLLTFYMNMSYRDMEEWLLATDQVCQTLELSEVPDHSTLSRMYKKMKMKDFEQLNRSLLDDLGGDRRGHQH